MTIEKGYVQIYTGNGKGKTTAAIGQGVRALGNGLRVMMIQFLKSSNTGELKILNSLGDNFKLLRFESKRGFTWTLSQEEFEELKGEIQVTMTFIKKIMESSKCDLLILDEILGTVNSKLITEQDVIELIKIKPKNMELVLTGRNASEALINMSDLVTEMKPIKHYFDKGIGARKGIEY